MNLSIEQGSPVPPFEQLRAQVVDAVSSGTAAAGLKLPTVRALADELGLATNTVARAYRELESDGVIETRGRAGSFIAATGDASHRQAQDAASAYADRIRHLRVDPATALDYVKKALSIP